MYLCLVLLNANRSLASEGSQSVIADRWLPASCITDPAQMWTTALLRLNIAYFDCKHVPFNASVNCVKCVPGAMKHEPRIVNRESRAVNRTA